MDDVVDYRLQPSQSAEGSGRARHAWDQFHFHDALDLTEQAGARHYDTPGDLPDDVLDDIRATVIEESELLGFWLAWHRAGGFAGLECAGWSRATIFRKVARFRTRFKTHPDDYHVDWITLDLPAAWAQALRHQIAAGQAES